MGKPRVSRKLLAVAQAAVLAGLTAACFTIVADDRRPANSSPATELQGRDSAVPENPAPDSPAFALTVNGAPVSAGAIEVTNGFIEVSPRPNGPGGLYRQGVTVTLQASPKPGYTRAGWGGDCSNAAGDRCTLSMDIDRMVGVNFQPEPPPP